jgi:predicted lipoprotein
MVFRHFKIKIAGVITILLLTCWWQPVFSRLAPLQLLTQVVDQVILPPYSQLVQDTQLLAAAVDALHRDPNPETLKSAQTAWTKTENTWIRAQAIGVGPITFLHYGQAIQASVSDSYQLEAILSGTDPLSLAVVERLQPEVKGLSTIQALLFQESVLPLSPRHLIYLSLISQDLYRQAQNLQAAWLQGQDGYPPFRTVMLSAGDSLSIYPSATLPWIELIQSTSGSLLELSEAVFSAEDPDPEALPWLKAQVQGIQALFHGHWETHENDPDKGLSQMLDQDLAQLLDTQFSQTLKDLERLKAKSDQKPRSLTDLETTLTKKLLPTLEEMV